MGVYRKCFIYIYAHTHIYTHTHTHPMVYYSVTKRNETVAFAASWMKLETIFLSEVTQEWKTKHHVLSFIGRS